MMEIGHILNVESLSELSSWAHRLEALTYEKGLVRIRGLAPLQRGAFVELAQTITLGRPNPFLEWDFGPVMELKEDPKSPNYLFSNERVPFHWDGAFHQVPGILVFNCITPPDQGGQTLFTDTAALLQSLTLEEQRLAKQITLRYRTEKKAHYGGELDQVLVGRHPVTGLPVLRFAERVDTEKNPVHRQELAPCTGKSEKLINRIEDLLTDPRFCVSHLWQEGDIVLADNHRLLHGRRPFISETKRHIRRIQLR